MNVKQSYNSWAERYDTDSNKTRDLEAEALRTTLSGFHFNNCLEIGCGTGKNTEWLLKKASHITAVDLSDNMLAQAKRKISSSSILFKQADITQAWEFGGRKYDLICFSLVLEHIERLDHVFQESAAVIAPGGYVYIGELHPYKQYSGTKARFDTDEGQHILTCFNHNISDFAQSAKRYNFQIVHIDEYFDEDNRTKPPRILTLLLRKS